MVSENLKQFKRGQISQKSLGIGRYREIPLTYPIDIDKIPLGTYVATTKDNAQIIIEFKDDGTIDALTYWHNPREYPSPFHKGEFRSEPRTIIGPELWMENNYIVKIQIYDKV